MEQHENEKQTLTREEEVTELQDPQTEPEAIPLGPDTQAIIIQSIN